MSRRGRAPRPGPTPPPVPMRGCTAAAIVRYYAVLADLAAALYPSPARAPRRVASPPRKATPYPTR